MNKQMATMSLAVVLAAGAVWDVAASSYEPPTLDTSITFAASDDFWQTTGHVPGVTSADDDQLATSLDNRWYTTAISTIVDNFRMITGMLLFLR